MTATGKMYIILAMDKNIISICYKISTGLLTAAILLLLFLIVVTGASDWVFTMLGWLVIIFGISTAVLFFLNRQRKC